MLDGCGCSPVLVSGSDLLKHWRATHMLYGCSPVLVSGSDLLSTEEATHSLDGCSRVLVSGSDLPQALENDSQTGWVFTHSHQCL